MSVEDLLSPMKIPSAKPTPVPNATPQCNLGAEEARSLTNLVDPKHLFDATPGVPINSSDFLAGIKIS